MPALKSIQNHGQRYHEPAVEAVVSMVVHKLERLDVERQVPLADAAVLFQPPLKQAYPALAVVCVDFVALAGGVLALAVVYGVVVVSPLVEALVCGVLVGHHRGAGLYALLYS